MREEWVHYPIDGQIFKGFFAFPDHFNESQVFSAVLVAHAWMGQDQFAIDKAKALAKLGYIGFALDLYGEGKTAATPEEASQLMLPLFNDRSLLQKRIISAFEFLLGHSFVDPCKVGAIGFCFGGLSVIELLRSGAKVRAVVSFHGVLGNKMGSDKAQTVPISQSISGSLLLLHGYEDPLVSIEDILIMQKEMNEAKVDWQMIIYGHTSHAFTNPQAHDSKHGLIYNSQTSTRAWKEMCSFFEGSFEQE